uniref:Uncharacterized protein n=1 Tax=Schizaphis graminum TaxID=13262 RepID=A0A2S2PPE6_SCHGA
MEALRKQFQERELIWCRLNMENEKQVRRLQIELEQKVLDIENKVYEIENYRTESARLNEENVSLQNRVIELTEELKNLNLTNDNLRETVNTRLEHNVIDDKRKSIEAIYKSKYGLGRLEMLVMMKRVSTDNNLNDYRQLYYGFRRQLNGMLIAINDKIKVASGDSVQLWLVTNSAVQDFLDSKEYLKNKADSTTGVNLKMNANNINVDVVDIPNMVEFNTVEVIQEFGRMVGMIEMDPTFLQTILVLLQNPAQMVQSTSASVVHNQEPIEELNNLDNFITRQSDRMVRDTYQYVLNDYKKLLDAQRMMRERETVET